MNHGTAWRMDDLHPIFYIYVETAEDLCSQTVGLSVSFLWTGSPERLQRTSYKLDWCMSWLDFWGSKVTVTSTHVNWFPDLRIHECNSRLSTSRKGWSHVPNGTKHEMYFKCDLWIITQQNVCGVVHVCVCVCIRTHTQTWSVHQHNPPHLLYKKRTCSLFITTETLHSSRLSCREKITLLMQAVILNLSVSAIPLTASHWQPVLLTHSSLYEEYFKPVHIVSSIVLLDASEGALMYVPKQTLHLFWFLPLTNVSFICIFIPTLFFGTYYRNEPSIIQ